MSTPAPVYLGLLLVIPALQIPLASYFGLDLAFIPPLALLTVQYLAASYLLHYLKKPFISGACRIAGLGELSIHSAQWTADNFQFFSMILGYVGILLSKKQGVWTESQTGAAVVGTVLSGLAIFIAINIGEWMQFKEGCLGRHRRPSPTD